MKTFFLLFLFAIQVHAQDSTGQRVEPVNDFLGGLNSSYPSSIIGSNQSQDAQNVFFDNGFLQKRGGSRKQNASAIGGGSADINNFFEYKKSDGTDYCVAFSSSTGYYSTDSCATFTVFMSSFTPDYDMNCVTFTDRLYCTNGVDTPFYLDGTTYKLNNGMPLGKYLRVYQNRLWLAGFATYKSYLYYSAVGDGTSWDTTFGWVGLNPEDGDVITGIGEPIYETLPAYKRYSSWAVQGNTADTYQPVIVNNVIGASHHRAIKNFLLKNSKTLQLFSSDGIRGSEPGIYSFNGIVVEYLSDGIKNKFLNADTFNALARYKQWTSGEDWGSGTSVFISSTQDVGVIEGVKFSTSSTSADDWLAMTLSNISTSYYDGGAAIGYEDFEDGNYTANPVWTATSGSWSIIDGNLSVFTSGIIFTSSTKTTGDFSIDVLSMSGAIVYWAFMSTSASTGNMVEFEQSAPYRVNLVNVGASRTVICTALGPAPGYMRGATVTRDSSGNFTLSIKGSNSCSGNNTSLSESTRTEIRSVSSGASIEAFNYIFKSTASLLSTISDTGISTTIGGPFTATYSTAPGTGLWFYVRESSTSVLPTWSDWVATSDTLRIPLTKQYWQYKADFYTAYSTQTPVLYDASLAAVSTGYWTSPETQLDAAISSWGLFQAGQITSGTGAWSYQIRASTYSGGTEDAAWTAVSNNTTISISTGAYVQVRATNSVFTSTDDAKVDSITINYNVGAQAKSATAEIYRNRYYWFGQDQNGSYNNVGYAMDTNGAWTKLTGINARSAAIINGDLYTGSSNSGFIYRQDIGSDDDSSTIDSYWQSKNYLLGSDDYLKSVDKIYLTYPSNNSTLTVQLNADGVEAKSWDVQLTTSAPFGVASLSTVTDYGYVRGKYFNVKLSNNSIYDWKVMGYRMYWTPLQILTP